MGIADTPVVCANGNTFVDLGFPDADADIVKAGLVTRIDAMVRQRGISQAEARQRLGFLQPGIFRLLRGDLRQYSLERLPRLLTVLGRDIDTQLARSSPAANDSASLA